MFTNTYYKWMKFKTARTNKGNSVFTYPEALKDITGASATVEYCGGTVSQMPFPSDTSTNVTPSTLNVNYFALFLGKGTSPESADDYTFTPIDDIKTTMSSITTSGYYVSISVTFTNSGADAHTLTEMALIRKVAENSSNPPIDHCLLFGRKLFDTPITIEAGASRSYTVVIKVG